MQTDTKNEDVIVATDVSPGLSDDNYEDFDHELDPAKLGDRLLQANRQKGVLRDFQFYGDRHLLIRRSDLDGGNARQTRVCLAYLSTEPRHFRFVDWNWLYGCGFFTAVTCLFAYLAFAGHLAADLSMIGGTLSLTLAVLTGLIFTYRIRDEFTFTGHFGGAELFVIENKRPSQSDFDLFFIELQQGIERAQQSVPVGDRLVGELKMCRRLRDEGVIDEDAYTTTRTIIFKHEQYRA